MIDHYICHFNDEDALIVYSEADAIKAVQEGATLVAKVCPSDGIWRECMEDLAQAFYHGNGPTATFPDAFLGHLDNTQHGLVDSANGVGE